MNLFEHFFKDWDLYMEARIRIRIQIKVPMIRINIKVMRIRIIAGEFAKSLLIVNTQVNRTSGWPNLTNTKKLVL
jgi:hypothetical protein